MATRLENLNRELDNICKELADLSDVSVIGRNTTFSRDGISYDWLGYRKMLMERQEKLVGEIQRLAGPFELTTRGY